MTADRTVTAYHEAGHACARIHYGLEFVLVAIVPSGRVQTGPYRTSPLRNAVTCLAGPVAEARYTGQPVMDVIAEHGHTDLQMAQDKLRGYDLTGLLDHTAQIVDAEWQNIHTVARALLANDQLRYTGVLRVLGRWAVPRFPPVTPRSIALGMTAPAGRFLTCPN